MSSYLSVASLPAAPTTVSWHTKVKTWGVMGNDKLGDCTIAAPGHAIQIHTANSTGIEVTIPDSEIIKAYSAVGGYVPGRPGTDQGCNMLDVLKYWSQYGIGGHTGIGYVEVDPANTDQVKAALWLFGGLYGGCDLPSDWLDGDWDSTKSPVVGGHAWWLCGYDGANYYVMTWGEVRKFTSAGWAQFMAHARDSELYAVITPEWLANASKKAPSGFDFQALANDLAIIANRPLPYPPIPTPVPLPPLPPAPPAPPIPGMSVAVNDLVVGTTHFAGTLYPK